MKRWAPLFALLAVVIATPALLGSAARDEHKNHLTPSESKSGWKQIFDGKTLEGWAITGNPNGWAAEDGAIVYAARGGGMVYTKERFKDFMFRGQFKVDPRVNSGIFVRWEDLKDPVHSGMEIQVLDSFGRIEPDIHDCGSLYDIMPPTVDAVRPAGEWNDVEITCFGPIVRVVLNSQQVINVDLTPYTTPGQNLDGSKNKFRRAYNTMVNEGHIGFQDHGGRVWFRNLRVKPLHPWTPPVRG